MSNTRPVTGGDLYHLWWVANVGLTTAENVYIELTEKHRDILSKGDSEAHGDSADTMGRCWSAWQGLQGSMDEVLGRTALSLQLSSTALRMAIEEFKYVDEDTSGELTQAGKDLETTLGNPNQHDPEVKLDGQPALNFHHEGGSPQGGGTTPPLTPTIMDDK